MLQVAPHALKPQVEKVTESLLFGSLESSWKICRGRSEKESRLDFKRGENTPIQFDFNEEISQNNMEKKVGNRLTKPNESLTSPSLISGVTEKTSVDISQVAKALAKIGDALTTKYSQRMPGKSCKSSL